MSVVYTPITAWFVSGPKTSAVPSFIVFEHAHIDIILTSLEDDNKLDKEEYTATRVTVDAKFHDSSIAEDPEEKYKMGLDSITVTVDKPTVQEDGMTVVPDEKLQRPNNCFLRINQHLVGQQHIDAILKALQAQKESDNSRGRGFTEGVEKLLVAFESGHTETMKTDCSWQFNAPWNVNFVVKPMTLNAVRIPIGLSHVLCCCLSSFVNVRTDVDSWMYSVDEKFEDQWTVLRLMSVYYANLYDGLVKNNLSAQ